MDFDEDDTSIDIEIVEDSITEKHNSLAFLGGRETGFTEGVNAALESLASELKRIFPGIDNREVAAIVERVRQNAEKRG